MAWFTVSFSVIFLAHSYNLRDTDRIPMRYDDIIGRGEGRDDEKWIRVKRAEDENLLNYAWDLWWKKKQKPLKKLKNLILRALIARPHTTLTLELFCARLRLITLMMHRVSECSEFTRDSRWTSEAFKFSRENISTFNDGINSDFFSLDAFQLIAWMQKEEEDMAEIWDGYAIFFQTLCLFERRWEGSSRRILVSSEEIFT